MRPLILAALGALSAAVGSYLWTGGLFFVVGFLFGLAILIYHLIFDWKEMQWKRLILLFFLPGVSFLLAFFVAMVAGLLTNPWVGILVGSLVGTFAFLLSLSLLKHGFNFRQAVLLVIMDLALVGIWVIGNWNGEGATNLSFNQVLISGPETYYYSTILPLFLGWQVIMGFAIGWIDSNKQSNKLTPVQA